jgi:hypothetical protein
MERMEQTAAEHGTALRLAHTAQYAAAAQSVDTAAVMDERMMKRAREPEAEVFHARTVSSPARATPGPAQGRQSGASSPASSAPSLASAQARSSPFVRAPAKSAPVQENPSAAVGNIEVVASDDEGAHTQSTRAIPLAAADKGRGARKHVPSSSVDPEEKSSPSANAKAGAPLLASPVAATTTGTITATSLTSSTPISGNALNQAASASNPAVLVFSGFQDAVELEQLQSAAIACGAQVRGDFEKCYPEVTHLVCPEGAVTMKVLASRLCNHWVMRPSWLRASSDAGALVAEDAHGERTLGNPFRGRTVHITPSFKAECHEENSGRYNSVRNLIKQYGGGNIALRPTDDADVWIMSREEKRAEEASSPQGPRVTLDFESFQEAIRRGSLCEKTITTSSSSSNTSTSISNSSSGGGNANKSHGSVPKTGSRSLFRDAATVPRTAGRSVTDPGTAVGKKRDAADLPALVEGEVETEAPARRARRKL